MGSSSRFARNAKGDVDAYLLALVHDELCAALGNLIGPLPPRIDGLPGPVVSRLPADIRNVVPRDVLMGATVKCESAAFDASIAHVSPTPGARTPGADRADGHDDPASGLALLCMGAFVRHHAARPRPTAALTS